MLSQMIKQLYSCAFARFVKDRAFTSCAVERGLHNVAITPIRL